MADIKQAFEAAVNYVKTAEGSFNPPNDLKLDIYALYKQATEGDVTGTRPGMINVVNRAKWDAWAKLKGISSEQAMQRYMDVIESVKKKMV
jgi:diazepam-binding inhibitor (GABA receptor modulating acyl-CoA-binding protein)